MNKRCPICLDNIKENGIVILNCKHQIHLKCYMEGLKHAIVKCPLCKKNINDNKKYYKFLNNKFNNVVENVTNTLSIEKLLETFED